MNLQTAHYLRSPALAAFAVAAALAWSGAARAQDEDGGTPPETPPAGATAEPGATPPAGTETPATPAPAAGSEAPPASAAAPTAAPAAAAAPTAAPAAPPSQTPPAAPPAATAGPVDSVTGVTLGPSGERQRVHAITRPNTMMGGKFEVSVTMPAQVNPKFTETAGNGLELQYHVVDALGIDLGGTYFWQSAPTDFTDNQLLNRAGQAPTTPEEISPQWEAHLAVEIQPIYAKMAFFSVGTLRFGFYLGAGAAVADTVIELQPPSSGHARTTGDTGLKPAGYFNTGFRIYFNEWIALKLELRDLMYASYANTIRGCSQTDVNDIGDNNPGAASAACQAAFRGSTGVADAHIAASLLADTSTELLNDFQFALAVSVLF